VAFTITPRYASPLTDTSSPIVSQDVV